MRIEELQGDVFGRLPLARLAFDPTGRIIAADVRATELLGRSRDELVGRSVLDLVHPGDLERCIAMFDFAPRASHTSMGPIPIRYLHADGSAHDCSLWVEHRLDDPESPGFTLIAVPATVEHRLFQSVQAIATAARSEDPLEVIAWAMEARPLDGLGFVLRADGSVSPDRGVTHADGLVPRGGDGGPWHDVFASGVPVVVESRAAMPEPWRAAASDAGIEALWCWPVETAEDVETAAVIVLWRGVQGPPGPTHRVHLEATCSITSLAARAQRRRDQLEEMAYHDQLTGLANRRYLFGRALPDGPVGAAVVYVDLDGFKEINDTHGHHAGDEVLVAVAGRIRNAVRETDLVSRVGGDEFVIVCPAPCTEDDASAIAERVLASLADPVRVDVGALEVDASIGIAIHDDQETLEALIRSADKALYQAKHGGRGQARVHRET